MAFIVNIIRISLITVLLSGCMTNSMNFNQGIKSFQVQDYRQAFIKLKPEAEKGQADAQYAIGYMYYYGQGVVEDRKKAWYWITSAARQGQLDAKLAMELLREGAGKPSS
ncbi:MAG: sel1 repeat family protein [Legionellaceae bacterium]|nr:sel1 repeat family protein [Legionellaceae bacterium]